MGVDCSLPITERGPSNEAVQRIRRFASERSLKAPGEADRVEKDECLFSLDTPFSPAGLFISLTSWRAVGLDFVGLDRERRGELDGPSLYLLRRLCRVARPGAAAGSPTASSAPPQQSRPDKMGIGVAGGFAADAFETREVLMLAVFGPGREARPELISLETPVPPSVADVCEAIARHKGTSLQTEAAAWDAEQEKKPSRYAEHLKQLPATRKVSPNPKDWKCEKTGATENLWLNLSDGFIGGGRRFYDGSGGSNGALDHYLEEKAKGNEFPLVVKLGTITPHGADVFSYAQDEDDLVLDPHLAEHLAHWGINMMVLEKTEKSMAELEVDLNLSHDWSRIVGAEDEGLRSAVRGPGLVGLRNLGNSCYVNATLQLLASMQDFADRYRDADCQLRQTAPVEIEGDLIAQVAKVGNALLSDRYVAMGKPLIKPPAGAEATPFDPAPVALRRLVGRGHQEFSSGRQQDAAEYLQHFLDRLGKAEKQAVSSGRWSGGPRVSSLLEFQVEERYGCRGTGDVAYKRRSGDNILQLPVHSEDAVTGGEVNPWSAAAVDTAEGKASVPQLRIPLEACLDRLAAAEEGVTFRGHACTKTVRLATMPRYLVVQVMRYYLDEEWTPKKLDCQVPMPDRLDLERLRGRGPQPGEQLLPEEEEAPAPQQAAASRAGEATPEQLEQLAAMGFAERQARAALRACDGNVERALEWLFSHEADLEAAVQEVEQANGAQGGPSDDVPNDGPGTYELLAFISHIGPNTGCGHYVCHARRAEGGGWVIFNDEKVAKSESPPKDLGYLYLYQRVGA